MVKWLFVSVCVGITAGGVGIAFHSALSVVEHLFGTNKIMILLLPFLGLVIVWLYRISGMENHKGTNGIFETVRNGEKVSVFLAPLVFVSTLLTHLGGGSAGREGAALQMGGSLGAFIGKIMNLNENDLKIITLCGMSATFCGLFGTPLTAALFCLEVINVGVFYYSALVPVIISSYTSFLMLKTLGIPPTILTIGSEPLGFQLDVTMKVVILAVLCAVVSIIWCLSVEKSSHFLKSKFKNSYIRIFICGTAIIILTFFVGNTQFNGSGMDLVIKSVSGERAFFFAFLLKILFTVITLEGGYRGGEIVPTFAVGALFASSVAPLLGLSPGFGAAIGMVSVFCGSVNCPLSSIVLSIELFGSNHLLYFALASAISYMVSGRYSLYSAQKLVFSKLEPIVIESDETLE